MRGPILQKLGLLAAFSIVACNPPNVAGPPLKPVTTKDAFNHGPVQCSAIRPKTEPGLMAWDPGERANLNEIRQQGLVVVRYQARGCDVELQVLSNCIVPGSYKYYPYNSSNSIVINNMNELYGKLPIGAARFAAQLHGDRGLRTDYELVGIDAIPAATVVHRSDLRGGDCKGATHVVSKIYVGGFALDSGEKRSLDAAATIFGAGAGGKSIASATHLQSEGDPAACKQAMTDGKPEVSCSTPLQIALLPIGAAAHVETNCASGMHFVSGQGCVPDATAPPAQRASAQPGPAGLVHGRYDVSTAGVVVDNITGLMWQRRSPAAKLPWTLAKKYCGRLALGGHSDWRLPTKSELMSIVVQHQYRRSPTGGYIVVPDLDQAAFPDTPAVGFWSSSPEKGNLAWGVEFDGGGPYDDVVSDPANVRCVRG